jgi:hypothetical protein
MRTNVGYWLLPVVFCIPAAGARANEITEWHQILLQAASVPPATNPIVLSRSAAIFQASIFDAVNGIERRFTSIYVAPDGPPGASERAAAVQAAYAILVRLYPGQTATFDQRRSISLANIASGQAAENSQSIQGGIEWGQAVADKIWAWRSTDGFTPAITSPGDLTVGKWRPTPPAYAPGVNVQFKYMTPWVMNSPSQFRPGPPPALDTVQYANDFNETKLHGSLTSPVRTADETLYSLFWQSNPGNYFWNQVAITLIGEHHLTFSETNRLLGLLNIGIADAVIGCWDAKYEYNFWRPITAIVEAAADGNPLTDPDAGWLPLFATPAHPDYLSGHACQSAVAARILANYFGDDTSFQVTSNNMPGVVRSFTSFSQAIAEVNNARVYAGIHFRTACEAGAELGIHVADFTIEHAFLSLDGNRTGQLRAQ